MSTPLPTAVDEPPSDRDPAADAAAFAAAVQAGHAGLADYYAGQCAAADQARDERLAGPGAILAAALYYAQCGLRVFPLQPNSKLPLPASLRCCGESHRHGCTDALADVGAVYAWWGAHPDANVAIATGHLVDVVDQDGAAGAVSWLRLAEWPAVIGTATTARGAGGVHRYVPATGRGNTAGLMPGIDYRGRGGYVVAPPSVVNGRRYAWAQPLQLAAA